MRYIRKFENFKKDYYEFNAPEFFKIFKEVFYEQKERYPKFDSEFFLELNKECPDWKNDPLDSLIEIIIKNILENKEVEFDTVFLHHQLRNKSEGIGRVKFVICYPLIYRTEGEFKFEIKLYEYENMWLKVNYSHPVKVYGKPTEIENLIDIFSASKKYNL